MMHGPLNDKIILLLLYVFENSLYCAFSPVLFFYVQQKLCTST